MKPSETAVTWAQALAFRLGRHLLDPVGAGRSGTVSDVVRRLGAVAAMDDALAELAVATRRTASRPGALARARDDGTVISVFSYRGAVHHMSPADAGDHLALRCAGRQWELKSWVDFYRLRPEDWPDFRAAVREALDDGPLTIAELGAALTARRRYRHLADVFADGAGTLVKPLTWQGDMCFGPRREGAATFQRLDRNPRWAGVPDLDDAGPRVVAAYLRTYGPATPDHVHRWFGGGLSAGRRRLDRWLADLAADLVTVDVEGTAALVVRDDVDALLAAEPAEPPASVRLLPGHDQWVMGVGTQDEHVVPPPVRDVVTRKANLVVAGGVVSGTWTRRGDDVTVTWLADAPRPDAAVRDEVARLGVLLDRDLATAWA